LEEKGVLFKVSCLNTLLRFLPLRTHTNPLDIFSIIDPIAL